LEAFIFGPGFAWMRAIDKRVFLSQRRTLGEILALYSPLRAEPARLAIDDLARMLETMEMINQRECLMVHDRVALTAVVENMESAMAAQGPAARRFIGAGLAALSEAQGRDAILDRLMAEAMAPGSAVPLSEILRRARQVLAQLH
jgi:hypothetical protein